MVSSSDKTAPNRILPTLIRVILKKLEVQRREVLSSKTKAEIIQNISLELIKPAEGQKQSRIKGNISIIGKWNNEGDIEPVVTFLGEYEARFTLPPNIPYKLVHKWMEDAFYRDSVIAQAIPTINLHMYSQLRMMGFNSRSMAIGYESKSDWDESQKSIAKPARRVRTKNAAIK